MSYKWAAERKNNGKSRKKKKNYINIPEENLKSAELSKFGRNRIFQQDCDSKRTHQIRVKPTGSELD